MMNTENLRRLINNEAEKEMSFIITARAFFK